MGSPSIELDQDLVALLEELRRPAKEAARELIVLELYRQGEISSGRAAQLLGMERADFIHHASAQGIQYLQLTAEELRREIDDSRLLWVPVVSNSSPLIAFAAIGELGLLSALFESVLIPPAVAQEIAPSIPTLPSWLRIQRLTGPLPDAVRRRSLGDGEREALALALEIRAERIILDDRAARRAAEELSLHIIGTAGILLIAKRHALIPRVRPFLDSLVKKSFFIGSDLYDECLRQADEQDSWSKSNCRSTVLEPRKGE
jgi:predicted nucleic acid-binding protein/predicted HTH domain antitoxin